MAAGVLLAQRDLAIAADELDGGRMERGSYGARATAFSLSQLSCGTNGGVT